MFKIGDKVRYYSRNYVKGSRRPGGSVRYTYSFRGFGVLLAKTDRRGHRGTSLEHYTEEQLCQMFAGHVGLVNATGSNQDGLTDGNNPVLLPSGEVVWVYREQIRKA